MNRPNNMGTALTYLAASAIVGSSSAGCAEAPVWRDPSYDNLQHQQAASEEARIKQAEAMRAQHEAEVLAKTQAIQTNVGACLHSSISKFLPPTTNHLAQTNTQISPINCPEQK